MCKTPQNVGKFLRALSTNSMKKLIARTQLIAVTKGNNDRDWITRGDST